LTPFGLISQLGAVFALPLLPLPVMASP
jgi:hypothetical protein